MMKALDTTPSLFLPEVACECCGANDTVTCDCRIETVDSQTGVETEWTNGPACVTHQVAL